VGVRQADILADLGRAEAAKDIARIEELRRKLVQHFPEAAEAAEAGFRLALSAMLRDRNLDEAEKYLRLALKSANKGLAAQARTHLGMLLYGRGKVQQAVFELRKVAGRASTDLWSAQALALVHLVLREQGNTKEAERARSEQLKLLEQLAKGEGEAQAFAHFILGMEHKHDGRREPAKRHLSLAAAHPALPAGEKAQVQAALRDL
jgi:tetratricopeptide (TPR) repeat protein